MSARRRLLVIKTSSLGDVVHALPAITDIAASGQQWSIDWVCEEAFADIPAMHYAVGRVIPCAIRRWRGILTTGAGRAEIAAFRSGLRATEYDLVLDLQSISVGGKAYVVSTANLQQKGKQGFGANKRTAAFTGGGAALGAIIGAIAGGGKGAAIGAGAGAGAGAVTQVATKGGAIKVPAETLLTFQLDKPVQIVEAK